MQPYKEDSTLSKIGKGVVNYGLGTATRIIESPFQLMMNAASAGGNLIEGKPVTIGEKDFVRDILPSKASQSLDRLEQNNPTLGGLAKTGIRMVADPTTWVAGGFLDDAIRAGTIGKGAVKNTTENLIINANRNQRAVNNVLSKMKSGAKLADSEIEVVKATPELRQLPEAKQYLMLEAPKVRTPKTIEALPVRPNADDVATLRTRAGNMPSTTKYTYFSLDELKQLKKELGSERKRLLDNQIDWLRNTSGKGVEQGTVFRDDIGDVVGRQGRVSKNELWYQDYAKANNYRKPTKFELEEIAEQHLRDGVGTLNGAVPPDEGYLQLSKMLKDVDDEMVNPNRIGQSLNKANEYLDAKRNLTYNVPEQFRKETPFTVSKSSVPPKVQNQFKKEVFNAVDDTAKKADDIKPQIGKKDKNR